MNKPTFSQLVLHSLAMICFLIAIQACKSPEPAIACQNTNPPCCQTTPDDPCYTIREQLKEFIDASEKYYDIDIDSYNGCPVMRDEVITDRAYDSSGVHYLRLESGPFMVLDEYIAETCPCDSSILLIDTTNMPVVPNELSSRSTSKEKSNGNGVFVLPPQFEYDGEHGYMGSFFETKQIQSPSDSATKLAIIDSGLSSNMASLMSGQIASTISLVENEDFDEDQTGHGDVVTSILDQVTEQIPELYIYRIINNDKISTSFKLACALRCAQRDQVDIVNMSLGNYINDTLLYQIIEIDFPQQLQNTILIASKGNDCLDTETMAASSGHYPSDYNNVLDVMGLEIDIAYRSSGSNFFQLNSNPYAISVFCLWECSNRSTTGVAPCRLTDVSKKYYGTSFAAPFASAKAADYVRQNPGNGLDEFLTKMTSKPIQLPGGGTFSAKIVE